MSDMYCIKPTNNQLWQATLCFCFVVRLIAHTRQLQDSQQLTLITMLYMQRAMANDKFPTVATASFEVDRATAAGKNCLLVAKAW